MSRVYTAESPIHGTGVLAAAPFAFGESDPNTYIRSIAGDRYVVALRAIRPGEEITYDYCLNGDGDTEWACACGPLGDEDFLRLVAKDLVHLPDLLLLGA